MVLFLLALLSVSPKDSLRTEFANSARRWIENARSQGTIIASVDSAVFERTVEELGLFLDDEFGQRKRERIFKKTEVPSELSGTLDKVTGKSFEELYPRFYTFSERDSSFGFNTQKSESEHFVIGYSPEVVTPRDIEVIKLATERAYDDVIELLGIDSTLEERLERVIFKDKLTERKIPVVLYANRMQIQGPEAILGGQTVFKPVWKADTVAFILEIRLAYPGPVGLYGIPHEMAHALALLFLSDEEKLTAYLRDKDYSQIRSLSEALPQDDFLRSEGWAFNVQFNHFSYAKLDLTPHSREKAAFLLKKGQLPDIEEIITADLEHTFREKFIKALGFNGRAHNQRVTRLEVSSADFVRFLRDNYSSEELRDFLTNSKPTQNAAFTVYKQTVHQLEHKWHVELSGREEE